MDGRVDDLLLVDGRLDLDDNEICYLKMCFDSTSAHSLASRRDISLRFAQERVHLTLDKPCSPYA